MKCATFRSDAWNGCAMKGAKPKNNADSGDLAETVAVHLEGGVDESAPHDTMVLVEYCLTDSGTAEVAVCVACTLPVAGGGTLLSVDTECATSVGVEKALANLSVAWNLQTAVDGVKVPGVQRTASGTDFAWSVCRLSGHETMMCGPCEPMGTDVAERVKCVVDSGVGETAANLADVDGMCDGPESDSMCCTVEVAFAFAAVLGGVGCFEYSAMAPCEVKVDVVTAVGTTYPGDHMTVQTKDVSYVVGAFMCTMRQLQGSLLI